MRRLALPLFLLLALGPCTSPGQEALDTANCGSSTQVHENLNAVLWVRTSLEYRHSTVQAYRLAGMLVERALQDRSITAALEQTAGYEGLPPAIILDLDETVLDNSPAQVQFMLRGNGMFSEALWDEWVEQASAKAIPGAVEFLQLAKARGVEIFYVTNREQKHEAKTIQNLGALEIPFADPEHVLSKGEAPGWGSDKTSRRRYLASRYRILLLVGDDAADFLSGMRSGLADREASSAPFESYLGTRWVMIPNPTYGSWENALWGGGYAKSRGQSLQDKCKLLP
jgi:acid phosphatase